ncbi:Vanillyl-alcohol oxidase [Venturia inaequalis]|nr:Vanillyl-alcohol oxidase [Venturia inaequalis]
MAPPKTPESKSTNAYTVKELGRRAKLSSFGLILDKSKRVLKQAESDIRVKLRKSAGFTLLSKVE